MTVPRGASSKNKEGKIVSSGSVNLLSESEQSGSSCSFDVGETLSSDAVSTGQRLGRCVTNFSRRNTRARERYRERAQGAPVSGPGRPRSLEPSKRNKRRQGLREERSLVEKAVCAFSNGDIPAGCHLQALVLRSKLGQAAFQPVAALVHKTDVFTQVGQQMCQNLKSVGKGHKQALIRLCVGGVEDLDQFCAATGLTRRFVDKAHWASATKGRVSDRVLTEQYPVGVTRSTHKAASCASAEQDLAVRFFMEHTDKSSGATTETREIYIGLTEMTLLYYAEYPRSKSSTKKDLLYWTGLTQKQAEGRSRDSSHR